MVTHVKEIVRLYIHCLDSRAGELAPRPYGETSHGLLTNVLGHVDSLYIRNDGLARSDTLPDD